MLWRSRVKCTVIGVLLAIQSVFSGHKEYFLEALVDGSVKMPCNVVPKKDDGVEFIFWYKNDGITALYTLDSRKRPLSEASHLKNETYSNRVHFHVTAKQPHLQMDFLREQDTGSYFCRVDYQWSATELTKTHLIVVVPPKYLIVRDDSGREVFDIAGPYKERSDVSLSCEAQKGFPTPNVTWWRDDKLYDNTFQKYSSGVVNDMKLNNVSRAELSAAFYCKAQNTRLTSPIVRTVVLDMYLYPLTVHIMSKMPNLSAGKKVEISCESSGSRPAASIVWRLNGSLLTDHKETVHENVTRSVLTLLPKAVHHGLKLSCKAENPKIYASSIQDVKVLNVTYMPQVSLRLIKEEADREPKEDDYVRLVCDVDANPQVLKVGWLFNEQNLPLNLSNTDTSGNTLVFKRLARTNRGRYRCYAVNEDGRGLSEDLQLNIMHAPFCKDNQQITYAVSLNQSVSVRCEVEAEPTDVTFKWEFSNTVHKHYNLEHTSQGTVSLATYRPVSNADYGTLFCWANNSVGHQQSSCFFTVIAPACKSENTKLNASSLSRDGSEEAWHYSAITVVAVISFCMMAVSAACAFYVRGKYREKRQRAMAVLKQEMTPSSNAQETEYQTSFQTLPPIAGTFQPILEDQVSMYSTVHCHNTGQQLHILIAK